MTTTELRETEQKYEARPGMALPPLGDLPGVAELSDPEDETLTAEYYDTRDLRLLQAGVTLRRREGGAGEGWHLKLPDDPGDGAEGTSSRREIQVPFGQAGRGRGEHERVARDVEHLGGAVPDELARLVRVHSRGMPLRPVARIETRRHRTTLRGADGASLAEVVADEVAAQTLGASTTLTRWDEVEVELTGGSPRLLEAANERLRRGGLRPAVYAAKLERAMADRLPSHADGQAPAWQAGRKLTASSPAGDVVLAYVAAQVARLKALDPAVRRDEPDAIHQMRVTARRLRAAFQAFPMVMPEATTLHARDELRWLGQVLGEARDNEVLSERFRGELASIPVEFSPGLVRARVAAYFAARQAAAQAAIRQALDSRRYLAILDELDLFLSNPPVAEAAAAPASEVLPHAIAQDYRRTNRRMRRARRMRPGQARDLALHETRKAAKRARYAAEAATPALGKKARRFASRMKAVQSALGDHQDAVTAGTAARQISVHAHLAGEDTFSFGLLADRAQRQAEESQRLAKAAWKRATRRKATSVTRW
jgi:CHAD domain-containing protein